MTASGIPRGDRDQARWAARGLLRDLDRLDPDLAARRRAQLEAAGLRWLAAVPDLPEEDLVKVVEAARALGVKASRVYQWRTRGPEKGGVVAYPGGVSLRECRALLAAQDAPREERRAG